MDHAVFLLICFVWGTSFVLMKFGLAAVGPIGVAAVRVATGAAALAVLWRWSRRPWPFTRRDAAPLLFVSLFGYALPFVVQPHVIGVIDRHSGHGSSFTGMMVGLVPLMTIAVSVPMLGVYPSMRQLVGVVGGLGFMVLLFWDEVRHGVAVSDLLLASVTPITYGVCNTYVKRRFQDVPAVAIVLVTLSVSTLVLAPMAAIEGVRDVSGVAMAKALGALLALGAICTGVAGFLFYKLIQSQGPLFAGMVAYIIPCVSLLLGWLAGESIAPMQLIALAGIFLMVALVQLGSGTPRQTVVLEPPDA